VSPCCIQALPSVIPQIFPQIPGPLPRWLTRCIYPFLPLSHRPSPYRHWVGSTTTLRSTTSERRCLTRLQSFDNLQASEFAATQVVPTAGIQSGCQGGRGVYIRAERGSLPPHASDVLAVRIGQLTAKVFHLLDLQPCWLLHRYSTDTCAWRDQLVSSLTCSKRRTGCAFVLSPIYAAIGTRLWDSRPT
jgi:hypothetical protein